MAVATARRLRADRVAKDIVSRSLAQDESHPEVKMSFPVPPQPPGAGNQIPVTSPNSSEPFPLPQGGPDRDALRKRKASRAKAPADLRRTASTPQLGKISPHDLSVLSPTDKRRNKLGYHRTSIACSHCRRRKIRCQIPVPDDPAGRCTNCIRLKKDCTFYAVDQATALENSRIAPPPTEFSVAGAPSSSSHSSPRLSGASHPSSIPDDTRGHIQSPQINSDSRPRHDVAAFGTPGATTATIQAPPFQFVSPTPASWAGSPHSVDQYSHRPPGPDQQYWPVTHTPTTNHFSHEPVMAYNTTTPSAFSPNFAYTHGGNPSWVPAPSRSISYDNMEGLAQPVNYQAYQYHPQESQPGYVVPHSPAHYGPPAGSQPGNGPLLHNMKPEGVPRSWSSTPVMQVPSSAAQQPPVLQSSYYPQQQTFAGFESRGPAPYSQAPQYYAPTSHPG